MMVLHAKDDAPTNGHRANPHRIDAEPYAVIIRELLKSHTVRELVAASGYTSVTIRNIALGLTTSIYPATAKALTALVELLPSERVEVRPA
jgi:hypothetical protein